MGGTNKKLAIGSPCTRSMSELCMKTLFEFTAIRDRFQCCMRVCKLWYTSLHQPYMWSNVSWCELQLNSPIPRPPTWLCSMMIGLTIVSRSPQENLIPLFQPWTNLSHLALYWPHYQAYSYPSTPQEIRNCIQEWMDVFTHLTLASIKATEISEAIQAALFSCEHPSLSRPPAITTWSITLKEFRLDLLRPPNHWPFCAMILVDSWPVLESFNFRVGSHELTKKEAQDFIHFFSSQRLPSLLVLVLDYHFSPISDVNTIELNACPRLYAAISQLRGLEEIDVRLSSSDPISPVSPQACENARTHLCVNNLDTLRYLSFTQVPIEFNLLSRCANLVEFRLASSVRLLMPTVEFFETIGAHHLPHLHTLAFRVFMDPPSLHLNECTRLDNAAPLLRLSTADHLRIQEILRGMKSLEDLTIWYGEIGDKSSCPTPSWLESIHLLLSLAKFTCEFDSLNSQLPLDFLVSLANAPDLREVVLVQLNMAQMAQLSRYWYERQHRHAPQPAALHATQGGGFFHAILNNICGGRLDHADDQQHLTSTLFQSNPVLSSLPIRIHTLTIDKLGLNPVPFNDPNYSHPMIPILQHLTFSLVSLTSLEFRLHVIRTPFDNYISSIQSMTPYVRAHLKPQSLKTIGLHWKEIIHFKQLRTLILDEEYSITSAVLKIWSEKGQQLQQLERLEFGSDTLIVVQPTDLIAHLLRLPILKYFSPWACLRPVSPSAALEVALKSGRRVSLLDGSKVNENSIHQLSFVTR